MRQELETKTFSADAGGGVVTATVNGRMELVDLKIAPEVLAEADDPEMLADLVKVAVSAAQKAASDAAAEMMKDLTGGLNIPGLEGLLGG